ncbi:hypothetical protein [Phenylobacterium sp.]|jgi:hypothetical protein|uniref:hypothetical protein n=1 Tax=Phenylobacterium sp. TaxID=1871053 RepID=UPI002E35F8F9|nr:hypothetical protein [Phenylobacterium sp.]HEX4712347.1 hypothetical protein [Phenylobacterium sp.]
MSAANLFEIARPLAWLAAFAFLVGFVSYLALGRPAAAASPHSTQALAASGPASEEWNLPKKI